MIVYTKLKKKKQIIYTLIHSSYILSFLQTRSLILQRGEEIFNGFVDSGSLSCKPFNSSFLATEFHDNVFAVPNIKNTKAPHMYVIAKIQNTIRHCSNVCYNNDK